MKRFSEIRLVKSASQLTILGGFYAIIRMIIRLDDLCILKCWTRLRKSHKK